MFGKQHDILEEATQDVVSQHEAEKLNATPELTISANSFANQFSPRPGELIFGERGIEFRALSGIGYIQIPWANITKVQVDIVGRQHVRALLISTDETQPLEFVVSHGAEAVRCIASHIGKDMLEPASHHTRIWTHKIKSWFSKRFGKKVE